MGLAPSPGKISVCAEPPEPRRETGRRRQRGPSLKCAELTRVPSSPPGGSTNICPAVPKQLEPQPLAASVDFPLHPVRHHVPW